LGKTCRDEILDAFQHLSATTGREAFSPAEIVAYLAGAGSRFRRSTIRTHVMSRLCAEAPANHAVVYQDLSRVARGLYRLNPGDEKTGYASKAPVPSFRT